MTLSGSKFGRAAPGLFVLLWSTGFIGAKYGLPFAGPLSFLAVRFAIVVLILGLAALIMKAPWPENRAAASRSLISGFLIHGVYLGGVFVAIALGMSAGISALIVGLQPLLTAILSGPLLGERITPRHWLGLLIGLAGVALVLAPKLQSGAALSSLSIGALIAAFAALVAITLGTIYQKAYGASADLRTGGALQYLGAAVPLGFAAWYFEGFDITWSAQFIGALAWLIIALSLGAITLLMLLLRGGAVSKISTLFYLVPPVTALIAYLLFGETLSPIQGVGFALAACAVWMISTLKPALASALPE